MRSIVRGVVLSCIAMTLLLAAGAPQAEAQGSVCYFCKNNECQYDTGEVGAHCGCGYVQGFCRLYLPICFSFSCHNRSTEIKNACSDASLSPEEALTIKASAAKLLGFSSPAESREHAEGVTLKRLAAGKASERLRSASRQAVTAPTGHSGLQLDYGSR